MIVMPRARAVAAALLWLAAALAQAQSAAKEYEPKPYQEGKDVVWLPTPQTVVNKMLDLAKVTARDT
ncbi:MAG: SAM-dependent methyltransferase, partial [Planctomycetota bacterium]